MSFGGLILTSSGRNLLAKAQAGKELKFTRVGLGDGTLGTGSITDLKALRNEVKSLNITNLEVVESNAEVTTFLSNANMTEGFYLREIGLFALDSDLGEILYCYDNSGKDADYIPPEGGVIIERNMRFTLIISNASNVTASIDSSLVFATKKDLENIDVSGPIRVHNEDVISHSDIRESIKGLGLAIENIDVPVKSVNNKTGAVTLTSADVGAVPTGRKVNNKALSADVTLVASDVGASPTNHGHAYSEISGKPSTFPPSTHTQDWGTISGKPTTFTPSTHTHASSQVGLGSVQNYGIATTAEAQAGAVNNKYMTPALTKAAIKHIATTGGISMVKSVQRGFYSKSLRHSNDATASDNTVNISNINPNKSEITINCRFGGHYEDRAEQTVVKTLNNNSFVVEYGWRSGSSSADEAIRIFSWQVIEYY